MLPIRLLSVIFLYAITPARAQSKIPLRDLTYLASFPQSGLIKVRDSIKNEHTEVSSKIATNGLEPNLTSYLFIVLNEFYIDMRLSGQNEAISKLLEQKTAFRSMNEKIALNNPEFKYACYLIIQQSLMNNSQFAAANYFVEELVSKKDANNKDESYIRLVLNYGIGCSRMMQSNSAVYNLKRAAAMVHGSHLDDMYKYILSELAHVYQGEGNYIEAEQAFQKIFQLTVPEQTIEYVHLLNSYANLKLFMRDYADVTRLSQEALTIIKATGNENTFDYGNTISAIIYASYLAYDDEHAERLFIENEQRINKTLSESPMTHAVVMGYASDIFRELGKIDKAISYAKTSMQEFDTHDKSESRSDYYQAMNRLALAYIEKGDKESLGRVHLAYEYILGNFKPTNGSEELEYADYMTSSCLLNWKYYTTSESDINRLIAASDIHNKHFTSNLGGLSRQNTTSLKETLYGNYNMLMTLACSKTDTRILKAAFASQVTFKNTALRNIDSYRTDYNFDNISRRLITSEAFIQFTTFSKLNKNHQFTTTYGAFLVIPGTNYPIFIEMFESKALEILLGISGQENAKYDGNFYSSSTAFSSGQLTNSQIDLKKLIWGKIVPLLTGIKTIYYTPDGLLNGISIPALVDESGFICDRFDVVNVMDINKLGVNPRKPINTFGLFGGIDYNPKNNAENSHDFEYSPDTYELIDGLSKDLKALGMNVSPFIEDKATESAFVGLKQRNPDAIIISTHGRADASTGPLLAMTGANKIMPDWDVDTVYNPNDGKLTAMEITEVDLSNTKLVILGGCFTASGKSEPGDGVWGIHRAFKMAGSEYILASLGEVDAEETRNFLKKFMLNLYADIQHPDIEHAYAVTLRDCKKLYPNSKEYSKWLLIK